MSSLLLSELRSQNENTGTNPIVDSKDPVGRTIVSPKMPGTIAIRYVSGPGSDKNDGLSWDSAKATVHNALCSLPGGNCSTKRAGSGTVYVGPDSKSSPTANAGIWLMGPSDPNYANPPAGWLKCNPCAVNIVGIPNTIGAANSQMSKVTLSQGGSAVDRNHPAVWISSVNVIHIANLSFGGNVGSNGRSIVIGECSNNVRTGCGSTSLIFDNVSAGVLQTVKNGPAVDITGGTFWVWFYNSVFNGNAYAAKGGYSADSAAAVLLDGNGGANNGIIRFDNIQTVNGAIKCVVATSNGCDFEVHDLTSESNPGPAVWITGWTSVSDVKLININDADSTGTTAVIVNDGGGPGPVVMGVTGLATNPMVNGPATVLDQYNASINNQTVSSLRQGQTGFVNGYVVGETDVARRIAGFVPTRFLNRSTTGSTGWMITNYAGKNTLVHGVTDPFGGTAAASASSTNATNENIIFGPCYSYNVQTTGDWFVGGAWVRGATHTNSSALSISNCGLGTPKWATSPGAQRVQGGIGSGDGQWQWLWFAYKVGANGTAADSVGIAAQFNLSSPITAYGPVLYHIPKGALSDNEVLEFASSMNSVDANCEVGQICSVAGHSVVVSSYRTFSNCSSVASPAKCDSAPAGSFVLAAGSTTARVNTSAVTANSQILVIEDSSLGAKLGVICNKTVGRTYMITDRTPSLSFTVTSSFAPTDHPACLSFQLLN